MIGGCVNKLWSRFLYPEKRGDLPTLHFIEVHKADSEAHPWRVVSHNTVYFKQRITWEQQLE